ncbi:Uncharacterised protein at_DN2458 [Pycnogonum litorale]
MSSCLKVLALLALSSLCSSYPRYYNDHNEYGYRRGVRKSDLHGAYTELDPAELDDPYLNDRPDPYSFGYKIKDEKGNEQYRQETGDESGTVKGTYGYTDAYGLYRQVEYIADKLGFKAYIKSNEPGLSKENPADVEITLDETPSKDDSAIVPDAPAPSVETDSPEASYGLFRYATPGIYRRRIKQSLPYPNYYY